ncbi:hypothetical protein LRP88_10451 [Fusarium phalaenopsidis]
MPSPTKKRKLNNGAQSAVPTRGLEYFFSKQRQNGSASNKTPEAQDKDETARDAPENLTDEELARKLQAEWDQEVANERQANQTGTRSTPSEQNGSGSRDESPAASELKPPKALPTMPKPSASGDPKKPTLGLQSAGMAEDTVSTSIPLDESPLTFEPSKYIPQLEEHWASEGGNASYALLTRCFVLISGTTSRIKIVDTLVNSSELSKLKKEELAEIWGRGEELVKACFARRPNYDDLVPVLLEIGISEELLIRCGIALHIPLRPMLGSITRDLAEMLTKLQGRDFACEYKYDGQRAQIHCDEHGKVTIFSRHLELMTDKYPDLVELMPKIRGESVDSFIMEGEVVAVDRATGELKNFQTLTNRARKDVAIGSITIDVCLFSFDLMYLNGQPLLDRPFRERRELLRSLFKEVPHHFTWVKSLDATSADSETVLDFFKSATENKCEGIMVKILDNLPALPYVGDAEEQEPEKAEKPASKAKAKGKAKSKNSSGENGGETKTKSRRKPLLATYEPDKRLDSWLKVKKDYSSSFDTLDLIPVAAWHGQGRKSKWWSPILMACRNEETGALEAVCKCMSGFTDAFYKANREFYDDGEENDEPKNTRSQQPSFVEYSGPRPDVWFEPQEVWEMAFADITLSPTYTAAIGLVSEERGLSLRFPRFLKKREDKSLEEASTNDFLAGLFRKQEAKASSTKENKNGAEEVEEADEVEE